MRITIDEIILKEKEIAEEFQRVIDTHMVSEDMSLEEMYCDDTEVIEEELKRCKKLSDYHNTIATFMRRYQQIEQIVDRPTGNNAEEKAYNYMMIVKDIKEGLEDGNNN